MVAPVLAALGASGGAGMIGNLVGGLFGRSSAKSAAKRQEALQREFAQNGIRWKVADAKAAGIHPLYALGAQTASYQPVAINDTVGPALAGMGQDISRAMQAQQTSEERQIHAYAIEQAKRNLAKTDAEIALLNAQAARLAQTANGSAALPPTLSNLPSGPQSPGATGKSVVVPAEVTSARPDQLGLTAGPNAPGYTIQQLPDGRRFALPAGSQRSEAFENLIDAPDIIRQSAAASGITPFQWIMQHWFGKPANPPTYKQYKNKPPGKRIRVPRKGSGYSR